MTTFNEVHANGLASGDVYGAPDFLARDDQLDIALELIAELHDEIGRMERTGEDRPGRSSGTSGPAKGGADQVSRRERHKRARARLEAGTISLPQYLRIVAWISLKSPRVTTGDVQQGGTKRRPADGPGVTSPYSGDKRIRQLYETRDYDRAHVFARALSRRHAKNTRFLKLFRDIEVKRGSLSAVLAITRRIGEVESVSRLAARKVEGRLRELTGWYPYLGERVEPVVPRDEVTILHFVKESRPYLSNGFTSRSHRNFVSEAQAGLTPVVVTEPGFPLNIGVEDVNGTVFVDGIEHRHIGLADEYLRDMAPDTYLSAFAQLALNVARDVRPAVIHASSGRRGYETALVGLAVAEATGLPFVYEVRSFFESLWTPEVEREEHGEIFQRRIAVEQMCIDRADVVITLGEAMRDELVRRGADATKIEIVPNGVDLADFSPRDRNSVLAEQYGLGDLPTFGYVSNLDHHRESQETLIEAVGELVKLGIDARCVLVGGGGRTAELQNLAARLGLSEKVIFTGSVDHKHIADYYSLIDLFVVPRINERAARYVTPLKPFEAMAMALPTVVSDLPALREIVDPPTRGVTFTPGNARSLADVLASLFRDPAGRSEIGARGRDWVAENRQWSQNGGRYIAAFKRAIEARETHIDAG